MSIDAGILGPSSLLNFVRTGPEDLGTIVLIHAVGLDLTYWDRQIEAVRSHRSVVAFDLPGHGRSAGTAESWSFESAVSTLSQLIESLDRRPVHLAGISFGGMIAQALALARPELIRSLILIGTASEFSETAQSAMRARAETTRKLGMGAVVQTSLERWFTAETRETRPDLMDRVTKTLLGGNPDIHAAIWNLIADFNVRARLAEIKVPTLVLVGEHDPSTPPAAAAILAEHIPHARLVVLPDSSHMVTVESPAAVNAEMIRFLQQQEGTDGGAI